MILDRIVAETRKQLPLRKVATPVAALEIRLDQAPPPRNLSTALSAPGVSLIAEVKRASPSRGLLCPDMDAVSLARIYAENGAAAVSVLTDEPFFQGSLGYLDEIRASLGTACPPLLRKDFLLEPYQIIEARAHGADAALLIVAILDAPMLGELHQLALELGLTPLVEVHDERELVIAVEAGAQVIGINNRDLTTFAVDLGITERLRPRIPAGVVVVSESGYHTPEDIRRAAECGVDAVLVGESLVTAPNVATQTALLAQAGNEASRHD